MKYGKTWVCMLATLMMAACATENETTTPSDSQSDTVRIKTTIGSPLTRTNPSASDEAQQKAFNKGDQICVTDEQGKSAIYHFNDQQQWETADANNFLTWDKNNKTFQAFYPADGINTFDKGNIQVNQSTVDVIAKSDYMVASADYANVTTDRTIALNMERKTSRIIINITKFNNQFAEGTKIDHVTIASEATIPASTAAAPIAISPLTDGEGNVGTTYTALVAGTASEVKVYFTNDPNEEPLTAPITGLTPGKSYTYNFIVGKNKIEIAKVTIEDWNDGSIDGGKAEEPCSFITFSAGSEQQLVMHSSGGYAISSIQYSVNKSGWKNIKAEEPVTFGGSHGDIRVRGKSINGTASSINSYSYFGFLDSGVPVACTGDIRSLINCMNPEEADTENARFCNLFYDCTVLTSAPDLPAKQLADRCYSGMFQNCTSLTNAPVLPATEMKDYCYNYMFDHCESLIAAPALPATELATYCYANMFNFCTNLNQAPALSASEMKPSCYSYMFYGCTSLKTAPELPATELAEHCYNSMFDQCQQLNSAIVLPATELKEACYQNMFQLCFNLSSVTMLAPSSQINTTNCFNWLNTAGVAASSRTLTVKDKAAYDALTADDTILPYVWRIASCTVKDANGNTITE